MMRQMVSMFERRWGVLRVSADELEVLCQTADDAVALDG